MKCPNFYCSLTNLLLSYCLRISFRLLYMYTGSCIGSAFHTSRAGQIFEIFKCFKCFKKYLKNVSDNGNFGSIEIFEKYFKYLLNYLEYLKYLQ